jgi:hypothetical protein
MAIDSAAFVAFFESGAYTPDQPITIASGNSLLSTPSPDFNTPSITAHDANKLGDVQVEISGTTFLVSRHAFQKLTPLPWDKLDASAFRLKDASRTAPEAFEKVLDYILFQTLPKRKRMQKDVQGKTLLMSKKLGLHELSDHLSRKKKTSLLFCFRARA